MVSDRRYINPTTGEVVDNPAIRPFRDVLAEFAEGATEQELGEAMWDLVQRVQDTGKAGSLQLTIKVQPNGRGQIEVLDEVKLRLPEFSRPTTAFYTDRSGNVSRRNPAQPEIPGMARINKEAN